MDEEALVKRAKAYKQSSENPVPSVLKQLASAAFVLDPDPAATAWQGTCSVPAHPEETESSTKHGK